MQHWVNKIWYQGHGAKWFLLPFSALFVLVSGLRKALYAIGVKKPTQLPVPVIVVGNITAGGSGKTPTVIYLIELLRQHGYQPGVISRGYGGSAQGITTVTPKSLAADVGDEPALIVSRTQVPMVVGAKRADAAKQLLAQFNVNVIISDDGLQHYALGRDIEIALVDGQRRYGNQWLIPAGPLRESVSRLKTIDWIINNGGPAQSNEILMSLTPMPPVALCADVQSPFDKQQPVTAIAGIGNPQRFFDSLPALGFTLNQIQAFDDHQAFDEATLNNLAANTPLLMTEKDAVKCRAFAKQHWWYLPVNAKLTTEFDHALLNRVQKVASSKQGLTKES
ncbi:tetraacyldisaccharide 4'-kinase [Shewanella intestini]|uniref:Tetraacyldisaccharide 4'-kinase n=1 Tax=Shewanella intestini TaxID=2017544 RepID=A0ABS5HZD8_9GAMM|nr:MULTISPECIES: tetraacyldisaccharide 4'-kinase [Shewanella]MBR9727026.1 tetraacyldisaccharide 4'-kinase [Shewanella intestini]MRG35827.1 tetraacyldisaccharide 4'-kinase [Shewanella sp. XMDDZSB0408]